MNFEPLRNFLDYCLPALSVPGSDTVIYKGREEVFRYQSGFDNIKMGTKLSPDALYSVYSITKVSTAIASTQLIERGEISITDPLYAYFPEYRHMAVKIKKDNGEYDITEAKNPILIKNLLTMTAGMNYDLDSSAIRGVKDATLGRCPTLDVVRALSGEALEFEPGSDYMYGLCFDVMGGIVELVSGMKLSEYFSENIFEPLGMKNTSFGYTEDKRLKMATQYKYDARNRAPIEISWNDNPYVFGSEYESGGAGLISCVDDQILLADALTHLGLGKSGNRILSSYGVNLMRSNQLTEKAYRTFSGNDKLGYGYGFGVRTNLEPHIAGNLAPVGEFGWDGAKLAYISSCPEMGVSVYHAEHMGSLHSTVIPRLRNIICSCMDY